MLRKNELVNEVNQILRLHFGGSDDDHPLWSTTVVAKEIVERVLELIQK